MNVNNPRTEALVRNLLSELAKCASLCDEIVVASLPIDSAPLPPNLSSVPAQSDRRMRAHAWLRNAQGFRDANRSANQFSRDVEEVQAVIGSLIARIEKANAEYVGGL